MSEAAQILGLALVSMFNPTLLAAVTVMLVLPNPRRLMFGYLLGAYTTSIASGILIVSVLHESGAVSTAKRTISPAEDIVVGALALLVAIVLGTGRGERLRERRRHRRRAKHDGDGEPKESLQLRLLGRGSPRVTYAVGVVLSFPGASYLAALGHIDRLEAAATLTLLLVVGFCLFQQLLLELPLIGYAVAPTWTQNAVEGFRAWLTRSGRRTGSVLAAVIGLLLVARGLVVLIG